MFRDPFTGRYRPPVTSTIRRILVDVDADALDTAVGRWIISSAVGTGGVSPRRRAYSVDGKTLRGSGPAGAQKHLLAAVDQHTGVVLGQVDVDGKTNEITRFRPLLDRLDLAGVVVTADALSRHRDKASYADVVVMPRWPVVTVVAAVTTGRELGIITRLRGRP